MMIKNKGVLGRLALIITTLIWGSSFVILKSALNSITPLWLLATRFGGAALILLIFILPKLKELDMRYIRGGALMGICISAAYISQTYGLVFTTPGKNAFLTATYCIFVPYVYWLTCRRKPTKYNIMAAVICMLGMGLVCIKKDLSINIGDALTILSGLFYAFHIIVTAKHTQDKSPILLTLIQFVFASAVFAVFALIFEPMPEKLPTSSLWQLGYLTVLCTALCLFLQTVGQKHTPPAIASVLLTLESVFGTAFSVMVGQDTLSLNMVIGFSLIFFSIIISETELSFLRKKKKTGIA